MADIPDLHPLTLLIEEETRVCADIEDHLLQAGFDVLSAADTDEASAYLKKRRDIRAVVIDAHVPGKMNGAEFIDHIRKTRLDLIVVMMSGHSDQASGDLPPGVLFISKPNLFEHLVPTLRRHLVDDR